MRKNKILLTFILGVISVGIVMSGCQKKDKSKDIAEVELSDSEKPDDSDKNDESDEKDDDSDDNEATADKDTFNDSSKKQVVSSPSPAVKKSTESDYEETEESVENITVDNSLSIAMSNLLGWGNSAGSNMKSAVAAVGLLSWGNTHGASGIKSSKLKAQVKDIYNSYNKENKANFKENFSDVSAVADSIIGDLNASKDDLDAAGIYDEAKAEVSKKNNARNWEALKSAISSAI